MRPTRPLSYVLFFFNDTATTEIYTLSLHDALPISRARQDHWSPTAARPPPHRRRRTRRRRGDERSGLARRFPVGIAARSEEHTSELQSRQYLVCRLLLEKKKK